MDKKEDLLGISETMARRFKWFTNENIGMDSSCPQYPVGIMRPGFVRVNLPYFFDDETVEYIIAAVDIVSSHGWKLLPQYTFNPHTGSFEYIEDGISSEAMYSLSDIDYTGHNGRQHINRKPPCLTRTVSLQTMLEEGKQRLLEADTKKVRRPADLRRLSILIPKEKRKLRWFLTPQDVIDFSTGARKVKCSQVVVPKNYAKIPYSKDLFTNQSVNEKLVNDDCGKDNYRKRNIVKQAFQKTHVSTSRNEPVNSTRETGYRERFLKTKESKETTYNRVGHIKRESCPSLASAN